MVIGIVGLARDGGFRWWWFLEGQRRCGSDGGEGRRWEKKKARRLGTNQGPDGNTAAGTGEARQVLTRLQDGGVQLVPKRRRVWCGKEIVMDEPGR